MHPAISDDGSSLVLTQRHRKSLPTFDRATHGKRVMLRLSTARHLPLAPALRLPHCGHMANSRIATLLAILQDHFNPREEGWMWVAHFIDDDEESGVVNQIEGEYGEPLSMADGLAGVINGSHTQACLLLCRRSARPTEADRELWRRLRDLVSAELLVDLVVFDRRGTWSMRDEDARARPLTVGNAN
jgi:hypothetical protein